MALDTVRNLLESSLLLARAINKGEAPDPDETTDAFDELKSMLGSWDTEKLIQPYVGSAQYETVAGQGEYALGPSSATWTGARPANIIDAWFQQGGLTLPLDQLAFDQYASIPDKSVLSTMPSAFMYNASYPDGYFVLWPIPTVVTKIIISFDATFADLTLDSLLAPFPPGYVHAIRYNLAALIANTYGKSPAAEVQREAIRSKGLIKSQNIKALDAYVDPRLPGMHSTGYDWRTDDA